MSVLVTGIAGFIGFHVARALLDRGETVIGIDNLNDYYDPALKNARLAALGDHRHLVFYQSDIADREAVAAIFAQHRDIDRIMHLAAQAGVRYSLENPHSYVQANIAGHLVLLEEARRLPVLDHFVYASSSSVYGGNDDLPFAVEDRVDKPVSLYAATKRSGELISHCYAGLYGMKLTGLRYFTVYGPWGRPDMAAYIFTKAISNGQPIPVFNHGRMQRDFTYIDDIVRGSLAALDRPPAEPTARLYNLGNHRAEKLTDFIAELENALGRKAEIELLPMQKGDVEATYADITASRRDLDFDPITPISEGVPRFVTWYKHYHNL